jgi:hypothetical protein
MAVELLSVSQVAAAPRRVAEGVPSHVPVEEPVPSYTPTSEYQATEPAAPESDFSGAETIDTPYIEQEPAHDSTTVTEYASHVDQSTGESSTLLGEEPPAWKAEPQPEELAATPPRRRYGQEAELPVDVANDEERRLHNDARRFARLLISEIKLYNEQKVAEGRSEHDLYDRLREYIDRSREMYDKRVKAEVAARYDYFHGELVNTLAEGDASKLGSNYPGATVNA